MFYDELIDSIRKSKKDDDPIADEMIRLLEQARDKENRANQSDQDEDNRLNPFDLETVLREIITKEKLYVIMDDLDRRLGLNCIEMRDKKTAEELKFLVVSPKAELLKSTNFNYFDSINTFIGFGNYKQLLELINFYDKNISGIFYVSDPNCFSGIFVTIDQILSYKKNNFAPPTIEINTVSLKLSDNRHTYQDQGKTEILPLDEIIYRDKLRTVLDDIVHREKLYVISIELDGDLTFSTMNIVNDNSPSDNRKGNFKFLLVGRTEDDLKLEIPSVSKLQKEMIGVGPLDQVIKICEEENAFGIFYLFNGNETQGVFISINQIINHINNSDSLPPIIEENIIPAERIPKSQKKIETLPLGHITARIAFKRILKEIVYSEKLYFGLMNNSPLYIDFDANGKSYHFILISDSTELFESIINKGKNIKIVYSNIEQIFSIIDSDCEIYYMFKLDNGELMDFFIAKEQIIQYANDNSALPQFIDINKLLPPQ